MTHRAHTTEGSSEGYGIGMFLDEIAWAMILIMTGALWLALAGWVPEGSWLLGFGLILLGINGTRRFYHLRVSGLGMAIGIAALAAEAVPMFTGLIWFTPWLSGAHPCTAPGCLSPASACSA